MPKLVSNKMLKSDRIHIEVELEDRIQFILKVRIYKRKMLEVEFIFSRIMNICCSTKIC